MKRLTGKYALITGGSSGIGLETAKQFIEEGATVAITGRDETKLNQAKALLGHNLLTFKSDAANIATQKILAYELAQHWKQLDVLYINSADVTHQPVTNWNEDSFDTVMNTNFKGPFFLIQSLLPMLTNPSSVILCGSVSIKIGLPQSTVYAASKAALCSLARTLSGELIHKGIRFNSLLPGPTETPALTKLNLPSPEAEEQLRRDIEKLVPLGRLGNPQEIAKAAVFLSSSDSSFMLGSEILVDGGIGNI